MLEKENRRERERERERGKETEREREDWKRERSAIFWSNLIVNQLINYLSSLAMIILDEPPPFSK